MTEQEIATFVEPYVEFVFKEASSLDRFYFLFGFLACLALLDFIIFVVDFICIIIKNHKQKSKESEDEK